MNILRLKLLDSSRAKATHHYRKVSGRYHIPVAAWPVNSPLGAQSLPVRSSLLRTQSHSQDTCSCYQISVS